MTKNLKLCIYIHIHYTFCWNFLFYLSLFMHDINTPFISTRNGYINKEKKNIIKCIRVKVNFGSKYTYTYIYSDYQPRKKLDESIIHIQLTLPALFSIITTAELELGANLSLLISKISKSKA